MIKMISIGEAAKILNCCVGTMRNYDDILKPVRGKRNRLYREEDIIAFRDTGKVPSNQTENRITIGYSRVSSHDQKKDLETQAQLVQTFCSAKGWEFELYSDIASGLNFNRRGFNHIVSIIQQNKVENVVVTYQDRLIRFGFELFKQLCDAHNTNIITINQNQEHGSEKELCDDIIAIITSFSGKLHGKRSHKNKKTLETLTELFDESNLR